MATFKRNKDKIYDENGNCINDGEQLSLDLSQKTSSTLTGDIIPDKNTNKFDPASNSDGEVILWNEDNFYDNFEKNTQVDKWLDSWLDEKTMMNITIENNLSETAFTVKEGDKYKLRWLDRKSVV